MQSTVRIGLIGEGIYLSSQAGREFNAEEIRRESRSAAVDPYLPEKVWS